MTVSFRSASPSDFDAIHALHRRAEQHDGLAIATPRQEWDEWLTDPHLDLATDTRVAVLGDQVVAWSRVWHRPSAVREARAYAFGAVDPDHRGRRIGSALLDWQLERATAIVRKAPPGLPRFVCAHAYDYQRSAIRLYERAGLAAARYQDELLRPLDTMPDLPPVPGVKIAAWDPARSEEARQVQNEAFADHWGSTPRDPESWNHALQAFGCRLDLSFLAIEDGQVVGVCRNAVFPGDEAVTGRRDGWILNVGVLRPYRKRGIASALIATSLRAFRAAGLTHSALGVDSENLTGAYAIYERLGYRRMQRSVLYQRSV